MAHFCTEFDLDLATAWGLGVFHLLQDCGPNPEIVAQCRSPSNGASISHTSPWSQPFPE